MNTMTPFASEAAVARLAHSEWANVPLRQRLRPVREFRRLLVDRLDHITEAIQHDIQRPPDEVTASEVLPVADAAKFLERHAERVLKPRRVGWRPMWLMGCQDVVHRRPWGVVGVIGTWNYPLFLNAVPVLHALAAGNVVLWKPSEVAPRFADVFAEFVKAAGFPPGCFQMLPATREAGPQLAEADVDFVHFTGSETVGRLLAKRLGERLVPSALELSGCDAMIVLEDADVELAARAAWYAATTNQGRTCMATRRVLVARGAWEGFVKALPVSSTRPTRAPGGNAPVGRGEQVLILSPEPGHPFRTEATFAPRLAVIPFDTLDDALRIHAESPFALTAAIFTRDPANAEALAAKLTVGTITVNDVIAPTAHPGTPFGGRRASGWGVTQGDEGLLQFTVPQTVSVRSGRFRPHVETVLTGDPAGGDVTAGMLLMLHGRSLSQRWRGLKQMAGGMMAFGKKGGGSGEPAT